MMPPMPLPTPIPIVTYLLRPGDGLLEDVAEAREVIDGNVDVEEKVDGAVTA